MTAWSAGGQTNVEIRVAGGSKSNALRQSTGGGRREAHSSSFAPRTTEALSSGGGGWASHDGP